MGHPRFSQRVPKAVLDDTMVPWENLGRPLREPWSPTGRALVGPLKLDNFWGLIRGGDNEETVEENKTTKKILQNSKEVLMLEKPLEEMASDELLGAALLASASEQQSRVITICLRNIFFTNK